MTPKSSEEASIKRESTAQVTSHKMAKRLCILSIMEATHNPGQGNHRTGMKRSQQPLG